jgi:hypothetical protein
MEELRAAFFQDKRLKQVYVCRLWTSFEVAAGCINGCKATVTTKGVVTATCAGKTHCKKCWEVFVDILPPTRSYLQRRVCMNMIGRSNGSYTPSCIMCYRYNYKATTELGCCAMCESRHALETGLMTYKWFLCREAAACADVVGTIMRRLIMFEAGVRPALPS